MSTHDHPDGAGSGSDDSAAVFRAKTEEETVSNPEKGQLVYSDSSLVQQKKGQLVYPNSNLVQPKKGQLVCPDPNRIQLSGPGLESSRKHGVPPSKVNTEVASDSNAQQFYGSAESKLHSKSLVNLRSPPDALPETGEGGKKRSMKLPLQRVVSSGNSCDRQPRSRRSRSEGTTPPKDKIKELLEENQKLKESLESISPLMVQQLKDCIISMQKELQSLQQEKKEESEEKGKFKALYDDEKRRNEEIEEKAAQFEAKITELEQVVYLLRTGAELSSEQRSLVRSVCAEQVEKGLDEAAGPTEQEVPDLDEDLPAEDVSTPSLGQQQQQIPLSQDEAPTCPFSALNNHAFFHLLVTNMIQTRGTHCLGCFQKVGRIDSHPYSRCILIAAAAHVLDMQKGDVEHMRLFWRKDLSIAKCADDPKFYKHATVAKACTYPVKREAFCGKCDNSTSDWEGEFSKQFGKSNIEFRQDDITEAILLIQMFRGSIFSIDIRHYMECQPCHMHLPEVGKTMRDLMMLHLAVCEKKPFADVADQCKQLKPIIFHNTAIKNRILFPMVVNVESYGIILYAQIPPYFWAVPSPSYAGRLTELDLSLIVSQIAELCSQQEQDYFDNPDNIDAKEWKETVPQPLLIFPLLNSKCGIKVNIPLE